MMGRNPPPSGLIRIHPSMPRRHSATDRFRDRIDCAVSPAQYLRFYPAGRRFFSSVNLAIDRRPHEFRELLAAADSLNPLPLPIRQPYDDGTTGKSRTASTRRVFAGLFGRFVNYDHNLRYRLLT